MVVTQNDIISSVRPVRDPTLNADVALPSSNAVMPQKVSCSANTAEAEQCSATAIAAALQLLLVSPRQYA